MLQLALKRVLSFSAMTVFGFALLMFDADSPLFISEAQACDLQVYDACEFNCFYGCFNQANPPPDCIPWCQSYCRGVAGC